MKLRHCANILFMLCFLAFLYLGAAATVLKPKETVSVFENRELASIPEVSKHSLWNGSWFSGWESYLKDHAAGRETLLKAGTMLDLFVIRRPVVNEVIASNGMLLGYNEFETVNPDKVAEQSEKMADNMKALQDVVAENGGVFCYVTVPGQYAYFGDKYPGYLNNRQAYTTVELADFKTDMKERGVTLIDMGDVFSKLNNPEQFYSFSDYHYTFYGAYETYRTIISQLSSDGLRLPLLAEKDLTYLTLDNPYLGSRGRKLFNLIKTGEKEVIGIPEQELTFTRTDDGKTSEPKVYSIPNNNWETIGYSVYMGGDVAETVIDTHRPNLPTILIVGDSFTNPVECLLYRSCNEMRSLDLRGYKEMSLADYIRKYKPEAVIMLRDYEALLSTSGNGQDVLNPKS